jgi:hypothetical protein
MVAERMSIPAAWLIHEITIDPYLGLTGQGEDAYGPSLTIKCLVEEKIRHIRAQDTVNSTGDELNSTATVYCELAYARSIPPVSRVTLPSGRVTRVLEALRRDGGNLPVPSHLELVLA